MMNLESGKSEVITTVCSPSFLQIFSIGRVAPYLLRASRLSISDVRWLWRAGANDAIMLLRWAALKEDSFPDRLSR